MLLSEMTEQTNYDVTLNGPLDFHHAKGILSIILVRNPVQSYFIISQGGCGTPLQVFF